MQGGVLGRRGDKPAYLHAFDTIHAKAWAFLFLGPQAPLSCANSHVGSGFCDLPRTFNIQGPVDGSLPQAICTAAEIIARKRFQFVCDAELSELLPWPDHKSLEARTVGTSCFLYDRTEIQ